MPPHFDDILFLLLISQWKLRTVGGIKGGRGQMVHLQGVAHHLQVSLQCKLSPEVIAFMLLPRVPDSV